MRFTASPSSQHVRDPLARATVAVGIGRPRHARVLALIGEQAGELAVDHALVGAHELQGPRLDALGALRGVSHHEHRLAEPRRLLLDAAGVGEDEVRGGHEVVEVQHLERLDDAQAVEGVELGVCGLPHERVHVDGVDRLGVGLPLHHATDGAEHAVHGLTEVLAAVRGDEDETRALRPVELGVGVALAHRGGERVDAGVAGHPDAVGGLALVQQVPPARLRGREVEFGDDIDRLAVELLGPGAVDVVRAQARLDVPDRDLQIEARQRGGEARRGVAVDEDHVGPLALEDGLELEQHVAGDVEEGLARPHDRQIVVGLHAEHPQHLLEHLAVLAGHADDRLELALAGLELVDERAHLDGLRSRAEDEHHFSRHDRPPSSPSFPLHAASTGTACFRRRTSSQDAQAPGPFGTPTPDLLFAST